MSLLPPSSSHAGRARRRMCAARAYALWAESYEREPNPLLALEQRVMSPMLPPLDDLVVLDAACGAGRWLEYTLARGARAGFGIDLSSEMLVRAESKFFLRSRLIQADCTAMPLTNEAMDLVICSFAAGYMPDLDGLAAEAARVAKPGGRAFVSDFHPHGYRRGWKRAFRHRGEVIEIASLEYSVDGLCEAFEAHGLRLSARVEPGFGPAERWIFEQCGKGKAFEDSCGAPAIFVCEFRKRAVDH